MTKTKTMTPPRRATQTARAGGVKYKAMTTSRVQTRPRAQGHDNVKGRYEAKGAGRQVQDHNNGEGMYEDGGTGRQDQDQDSGDTDSKGEEAEGVEERVNTAEPIDDILNIAISEKKMLGSICRNNGVRPYNKGAKHTRYQTDTRDGDLGGEGRGQEVRGQDNVEGVN